MALDPIGVPTAADVNAARCYQFSLHHRADETKKPLSMSLKGSGIYRTDHHPKTMISVGLLLGRDILVLSRQVFQQVNEL